MASNMADSSVIKSYSYLEILLLFYKTGLISLTQLLVIALGPLCGLRNPRQYINYDHVAKRHLCEPNGLFLLPNSEKGSLNNSVHFWTKFAQEFFMAETCTSSCTRPQLANSFPSRLLAQFLDIKSRFRVIYSSPLGSVSMTISCFLSFEFGFLNLVGRNAK